VGLMHKRSWLGQKEAEFEFEVDFQNENDLRIGVGREGRLVSNPDSDIAQDPRRDGNRFLQRRRREPCLHSALCNGQLGSSLNLLSCAGIIPMRVDPRASPTLKSFSFLESNSNSNSSSVPLPPRERAHLV
jgi:hypothetical protein